MIKNTVPDKSGNPEQFEIIGIIGTVRKLLY